MSVDSDDPFGLRFKPGDEHYRAYVGPPRDYDRIAGLQFALLFQLGLKEKHHLLDLGCGSLRAGRLFIPYLRPGHYYGVEPNHWLVEEGIARELGSDILEVKQPTFSRIADFSLASLEARFDFVLAHSVFSHAFPDLVSAALAGVRETLKEKGVLVATFVEGGEQEPGSGWKYPGGVSYSWPHMTELANDAGLFTARLSWFHPRQAWFAAASDRARVDELVDLLDSADNEPPPEGLTSRFRASKRQEEKAGAR